jgi:hypothetical protein
MFYCGDCIVNKILKGQYEVKMRATQEEKNDTQHLEFTKAEYIRQADFYWPITMKSCIKRRPNIKMIDNKHNLQSSSVQRTPASQPFPEAAPQPKTSATATAPSQLYSAIAAIACRISCPVSAALSYREGAKWMLGMTSFFGICDNSPCRHRHRSGMNLKNSRRSESTDVLASWAKP